MNWTKTELKPNLNIKLVLKTLNNELFQNIPILKKLDNEYWEEWGFFLTHLALHQTLLIQTIIKHQAPITQQIETQKKSMWHLSNGRHDWEGKRDR
jgi:hypothetical protein